MELHATHRPNSRHLAGIFLISLGTLLLELSLTRVLSVALWYHFGFLVISTALLGFGASGVTLALWTKLRERDDLDGVLALLCLAFSATTFVSFWLMQRIPFDPFSVAVEHSQFFYMPFYFCVIAIPFFCSGLTISLLLSRSGADVNHLYAFDLIGAGLGCALVTAALPRFGGSGSVMLAGAIGASAAVFFAWRKRRAAMTGGAIAALALLLVSTRAERVIPIHVSTNKIPNSAASVMPSPIYSAWNGLSFVQVIQGPTAPGAPQGTRRMVIDAGTAATGLQGLRPDVTTALAQRGKDLGDESGIAYPGKPSAHILIIGSGGGSQVLTGLKNHAASITAVEINPIINDIVAGRMNDYWGDLFHQPQVHLFTDEGRSFVRRSHEQYDAIISVHTISNAAMASGALSLAENYVLTQEAFEDYLDHLSADGRIYFTRPLAQVPRLFSTAREAFAAKGLGSVEGHLMAFSQPYPPMVRAGLKNRQTFSAGFLLKKSAFRPEEAEEVRALLKTAQTTSRSSDAYQILYAPDDTHPASIFDQIVRSNNLKQIYDSNDTELAPATDDKPFFNQHTRWSRLRWPTIVDLFSQKQAAAARMALEDRPVAEVTLLVLLLQSMTIAALFILAPLAVFRSEGLAVERRWTWLAYFAALGLGFIMIEIALLQRFLLFLGQPIYTYAVVLAGLLVFTGMGSHFSGTWKAEPADMLKRLLPFLLLVVIATSILTPLIFAGALGLPLALRIAISIVLVAPLGFVLGMPFPVGLRLATRQSSSLAAWAWSVNGFFTVIGTVLALMLGMMIGFRMVLLLACACYGLALLAITELSRVRTQPSLARSAAE